MFAILDSGSTMNGRKCSRPAVHIHRKPLIQRLCSCSLVFYSTKVRQKIMAATTQISAANLMIQYHQPGRVIQSESPAVYCQTTLSETVMSSHHSAYFSFEIRRDEDPSRLVDCQEECLGRHYYGTFTPTQIEA